MIRVHEWSTIRSGATMTVSGQEMDCKQPVKLTGVDLLRSDGDRTLVIRGGKTIAELYGNAKP